MSLRLTYIANMLKVHLLIITLHRTISTLFLYPDPMSRTVVMCPCDWLLALRSWVCHVYYYCKFIFTWWISIWCTLVSPPMTQNHRRDQCLTLPNRDRNPNIPPRERIICNLNVRENQNNGITQSTQCRWTTSAPATAFKHDDFLKLLSPRFLNGDKTKIWFHLPKNWGNSMTRVQL